MDHSSVAVLFVDCDMPYAAWLESVLLRTGTDRYSFMHVTSLSAALEELDRGEVRLIMMSLSLSDAAGLPALARMRASARGAPIVVLGARYHEETAMRAVREGAEDYLVKGDVSEQAMLRIVRYTAERVRVER